MSCFIRNRVKRMFEKKSPYVVCGVLALLGLSVADASSLKEDYLFAQGSEKITTTKQGWKTSSASIPEMPRVSNNTFSDLSARPVISDFDTRGVPQIAAPSLPVPPNNVVALPSTTVLPVDPVASVTPSYESGVAIPQLRDDTSRDRNPRDKYRSTQAWKTNSSKIPEMPRVSNSGFADLGAEPTVSHLEKSFGTSYTPRLRQPLDVPPLTVAQPVPPIAVINRSENTPVINSASSLLKNSRVSHEVDIVTSSLKRDDVVERSVSNVDGGMQTWQGNTSRVSSLPRVSREVDIESPRAAAEEFNPSFNKSYDSNAQYSASSFEPSDSSVTIYGLDDDYSTNYQVNNQGSDQFASSYSAQPIPQPTFGGHDSSVEIFEAGYGAGYTPNNSSTYGYNVGSGTSGPAGQIFFKHGSSRLGSGDLNKISNLADQAKFAPVNYITVEGFASKPTQAGSNTAQAHIINLRQSLRRSEKVSKALVKKGVPGDKIKTVSWGASKATGNDAQDRRVDVVMGEN